MFNAPDIIINIPDIAEIYEASEQQCQDLEEDAEQMDKNLFLDQMDEAVIARWESMLGIVPLDDDKLTDRRFRVKVKALEKLPYSYRVMIRKLDTICPEGHEVIISENKDEIEIKISLKSKKMVEDVKKLMEDILPLNMVYKVRIIWNQYFILSSFTHNQLKARTHKEIREEVFADGE